MSFTHHATGRLQLSVRNTLEVLLAAAVVFGAVAHGPEGRQEVFHRLKVSGHHGFFSGGDKEKHTQLFELISLSGFGATCRASDENVGSTCIA